jgi:hypothetical protein
MPSMPTNRHSLPAALAVLIMGHLMTVSLLAQRPAQAVPSQPALKSRSEHELFIRFPAQSLGKLATMNQSGDPLDVPSVGPFYSQAKGLVQIKPGLTFMFEPNPLLYQHTEVLSAFPAGTLYFLDLSKLEATEELLAAVSKLHSLRALKLEEADIKDDHMKQLGTLVHLQFLNISGNLIKGPGLQYLRASKDLRRLEMGCNKVDRNIGQNLTLFPKLGCLLLYRDCLQDSDLVSIAKIQTLEYLKLSSNRDITDSGIKALIPLKHLRRLEVDDTQVTAAGLLVLKGSPLRSLIMDSRYNNKYFKTMLARAFPVTNIEFTRPRNSIPIEVFAPLH